ncbi:hypothetical protein AMECASPLE_021745 [Ameca splendens]|uniref:Uncharacterized protein n=1 Tax=Ameca splendens TaxID=208324 RepID=A0ABV0Z2I4_9TELE
MFTLRERMAYTQKTQTSLNTHENTHCHTHTQDLDASPAWLAGSSGCHGASQLEGVSGRRRRGLLVTPGWDTNGHTSTNTHRAAEPAVLHHIKLTNTSKYSCRAASVSCFSKNKNKM